MKESFFHQCEHWCQCSSGNENHCFIMFEEAFLFMLSLYTSKESKKQILSVRLCPLGIQFTLLFANWPKVSREIDGPGSRLLGMKSSLPRHFVNTTWQESSECGMLKDFNRLTGREGTWTINCLLEKNEQRQYFDSHRKKIPGTRVLAITKTLVLHILPFLATFCLRILWGVLLYSITHSTNICWTSIMYKVLFV